MPPDGVRGLRGEPQEQGYRHDHVEEADGQEQKQQAHQGDGRVQQIGLMGHLLLDQYSHFIGCLPLLVHGGLRQLLDGILGGRVRIQYGHDHVLEGGGPLVQHIEQGLGAVLLKGVEDAVGEHPALLRGDILLLRILLMHAGLSVFPRMGAVCSQFSPAAGRPPESQQTAQHRLRVNITHIRNGTPVVLKVSVFSHKKVSQLSYRWHTT